MSQIGSVLGWPLFAMPLMPGQRQVEWSMQNVVGQVTNPFTGRQQFQSWQAGWWEAVVSMPPMPRPVAESWVAFMASVQGQSGVFYFGDGLGNNAQGSALGQGVTSGSFQGGYQLTTKGWSPNQFALFSPGDWIQVGYRLHKILDQAQSDGAGNSSFSIWPQIRELPPDGTEITAMGAKGLFRMASNSLKYSVSYLRTYGLSFPVREAI